MEIRTKISLLSGEGRPFMGPGILKLLRAIDRHRSINKAAKAMRLSYVKALGLLNRLEADLGEAVVVRTRGGNAKGGTALTEAGRCFMEEYDRLEGKVRRGADRAFEAFLRRLDREDR